MTKESLRRVDPLTLGADEVRRIARELLSPAGESEVRIALGGNVVFEPLPDFLRVHLAHAGLGATVHAIDFGQVMQALLDKDSQLHRFQPNFLFLHFETDELLRGYRQRREFGTAQSRRQVLEQVIADMASMVSAALASTAAVILLANFTEDGYDALGTADWRSEFGEREFFATLNSRLAKQFGSEPRVQMVDLAGLTARFGRSRARDQRLFLLARIAWDESFMPLLANELVRHIEACRGPIRKCLVVDLDNTLWAGVLGEDGAHGVRVGSGDATSEAHFRLQQKILALKERGILLAICSKNNPEDVAEIFRTRTDMPLRAEDFVSIQAGWERKDLCLRRIAAELNLGTDSLVFLDDEPAEIELVASFLPEVACVLLPSDVAARAVCLDGLHGLDRTFITTEDQARTATYREEKLRTAARHAFDDFAGYLRSLQTCLWLEPLEPSLVARAHQLFSKTNQFNVTGRRYSPAEVERCIGDPASMAFMFRATDRFGDLGWIAAAVLRVSAQTQAHIENIVISCRALGRGVDVAILNCLKRICFEINDCACLTAQFRPSRKNAPAAQVFDHGGFEVTLRDDAGTHYRLGRERSAPGECDWITVQLPAADRLRRAVPA